MSDDVRRMPENMGGLLIGVVSGDDGNPYVGFSIMGKATIAVHVNHAGAIFSQLGDLLDSLGYFKESEGSAIIDGEEACRMH